MVLELIAAMVAARSPNLATTMTFVRDKSAAQGTIIYDGNSHDSSDNSDWTNHFVVEASKVTVSGKCTLSYHWATSVDGKNVQDQDNVADFADTSDIVLTSMEEDVAKNNLAAGHASYTTRIAPPVWVITVKEKGGHSNVLDFRDRDLAERMVKAMRHAATLCGGLRKEAF